MPVRVRRRSGGGGANTPGGRIDLWFPLVIASALVVVTVLGISGSSVALLSEDGTVDESVVIQGDPLPIRSDEWLLATPIKTGQVRAGFPDERVFGMGEISADTVWRHQLPSRSLGSALFAPFNLPLALLPLDQGFALSWWLPFAACALGVYVWLRLLGVGPGAALAASVLVTTAPASVWWSGSVAQAIALAVIPCSLLMAATKAWLHRRKAGIVIALIAGLAAASLPWWYQPWVIPVSIFTGGVTVLWGVGQRTRRPAFLLAALVAGGLFVAEQAVYLLHERAYYEALGNTVYPGARRSTGGGVPLGKLMSSLFPFAVLGSDGGALARENLSEISMGWTIALPVALGAGGLGWRSVRRDPDVVLLGGTAAVAVVLTSWCLVHWPAPFATLTMLTFSPPERTAPFVGYFGVVLLAILLGVPERRQRLLRTFNRAGVAAVVTGVTGLAAWGALGFRADYLPGLSAVECTVTVAVVAALVLCVYTRWSSSAIAAATVMAGVSGAMVNPLIDGLGSLGNSPAAQTIRRIERQVVRPQDGTWAADDIFANGLLNGQGVESLSSFNDPVSERSWRMLDPSSAYETSWNRLGEIIFRWQPGERFPLITAPVPNQVHVHVDPCDERLSDLNLKAIVSSRPLAGLPCLRHLADLYWYGRYLTVYERAG